MSKTEVWTKWKYPTKWKYHNKDSVWGKG